MLDIVFGLSCQSDNLWMRRNVLLQLLKPLTLAATKELGFGFCSPGTLELEPELNNLAGRPRLVRTGSPRPFRAICLPQKSQALRADTFEDK